jgi:tmRNA-binding protein
VLTGSAFTDSFEKVGESELHLVQVLLVQHSQIAIVQAAHRGGARLRIHDTSLSKKVAIGQQTHDVAVCFHLHLSTDDEVHAAANLALPHHIFRREEHHAADARDDGRHARLTDVRKDMHFG